MTYLNVEMELMKRIAQRTLEAGEPVWFGCDVGKQMRRDLGLMDRDLYDLEALYDSSFDLDKAARLEYGETQMTHAMLFTGVDVVDGDGAPLAGRELVGRGPGPEGLLHDERLVVRRVHVRDRRPQGVPARRAAERRSTWSRSSCRRGTRWARSRASAASYEGLPDPIEERGAVGQQVVAVHDDDVDAMAVVDG